MEFRILGPLEVLDAGRVIEITGAKQRTALALLVLRANEVVRTQALIDALWGDEPPSNAPAAMHNHVSRLRKAIGPDTIVSRDWGYTLRVSSDAIDLRRFEHLLLDSDQLPASERSACLAAALSLWRGGPLADLAGEPALRADIAWLEELRIATLERRIDADLEAGRGSDLIGELEALIGAHPFREHLRSQLILALYRAGRQAEALEVYRETRRTLADELGLEPSPELRELERAILRQDPSLAGPAGPASPADDTTVRPLPPASRRRRWLAGGIAGVVVVALGASGALAWGSFRHHHRPASSAHATVVAGELVKLSDGFGADQIDGGLWYQIRSGSRWTMVERDGRLEFRFPASARPGGQYDDFGGHVGTLCSFPGDFDARVDFQLRGWRPGTGVFATLFSFLGPENAFFQASRAAGSGGDTYASYTGYWSNYSTTDAVGSLRVARRRGVVTTYFMHSSRWRAMRSARETEPAVIAVGALAMTTAGFDGRTVVVDFTNFSVTGVAPKCPPNATLPSRS